ncbi:MAG TPA: hypothetical protein RMH99_04440 [Sandaracinaceae bacterium LLY-WYZ-13_1]|nr:hypothetical protein [Sandaracinaceae bacterium LLY-WYZ-13_1]
MSRRFVRFALVSALAVGGCAAHHGRGEGEPVPGPCDPSDCYVVTTEGCLDMEDYYMPDHCPAECIDGYAPVGWAPFCEEPSPTCDAYSVQYGYEGATVTDGEATIRRILFDDHSSRGEVVLALPDDGELVFAAPREHLSALIEGEVVRIAIENEGGATLHHLTSPSAQLTAVRAWSTPPPHGFDVGDVRIALGGTTCRTPSTPPECGMDSAYRLNVSRDSMVPQPLEPGESASFPTPIPEGSPVLVTHGGAVEYGAEDCEVFAPWSISVVVSQSTTFLAPG